jgi:pheromone shutdown protein TraB
MFLSPAIWFIPLGKIAAHRRIWIASNIGFGIALIALRAHVWTVIYHDGVGLQNFWIWALFTATFFGIAAEAYARSVRLALVGQPRTHATQPG